MIIRPYETSDAEAIARVFVQAVEVTGARFYTHEQVAMWASRARTAEGFDQLLADGRLRLVIEDESGAAAAFIDIELDGHIDLIYAAPEITGTGQVSLLYDAAEAEARARGCTRLYAESSESARPFFERKGFGVTHRRDVEVGGVAIHNWAVVKVLS